MIALRKFIWFCAVCVLACGIDRARGASPPAWRPFREIVARPAPTQVVGLAGQQYSNSSLFDDTSVQPMIGEDFQPLAYQTPAGCCGGENYPMAGPYVDPILASSTPGGVFELLPSDVIWHSYWASAKESRTSAIAFEEFSDDLSLLDVSLGGRTAILRDAAQNQNGMWQGWELQIEGAAMLRLNLDQNWDFDSVDFRFGVPLILARNQMHYKLAYYHLSSHVGDEFLVRNPGFTRINFSRDVLVVGASYFPAPALRLYGETGYAFYDDEGSDPWEFQFGFDLAQPGPTGRQGTPFLAVNGHLREEVHFGGNFAIQGGWLWRGQTGRVLRTGLHYYNGKSPQFEFFNTFEQHLGFGLWQEY